MINWILSGRSYLSLSLLLVVYRLNYAFSIFLSYVLHQTIYILLCSDLVREIASPLKLAKPRIRPIPTDGPASQRTEFRHARPVY
jgi:hypothetical protein